MRTVVYVTMAAALAFAFRFDFARSEGADKAGGKIEISVEELGKTADLIGRLGKPLGSWVTIKGKWALPDRRVKDYSLKFTVTHVNDVKLKQPVEFNVAQVSVANSRGESVIPKHENQKQLDGQTWTLKAYETGEFHITPPEYYKAIGVEPGSMQEAYYTRPFTSRIDGVLQP